MSPIRKDIGTKQQGRYMFVEHREYKFQRYEGKQPNENEQVWKTLETQKLYCIISIIIDKTITPNKPEESKEYHLLRRNTSSKHRKQNRKMQDE